MFLIIKYRIFEYNTRLLCDHTSMTISWQFDGRPLMSRAGSVHIRNHSLFLKRVPRELSGRYRCVSANVEGEGFSQDVHLKVLCKSQSIIVDRQRELFLKQTIIFSNSNHTLA